MVLLLIGATTMKTIDSSFLNDNYFPVAKHASSTMFENAEGSYPVFVQVFDDNSWSAYSISHVDVPERTGTGGAAFAEAYPNVARVR